MSRAIAVVLAALSLSSVARAEQASTGIVADRFVPGVGPLTLLAGEGAEITPAGRMSLALSLGWVADPIRLETAFQHEVISRPVSGQLTGDLAMELGVWKHLAVGVGVPVAIFAEGDRLRGTGVDERPLDYPTVGDLRLRAKAAFVGDPARPGLHLAAMVVVTVPCGGESSFAATSGVTGEPRLLADLRFGPLLVVAELGVRFGPDRQLFQTDFNDELTWLGGAEVRLFQRGQWSGAALLEAAGGAGGSDGTRPAELRGGLRIGRGALSVDLAAGVGLDSDVGAPAWRVLAVLRHAVPLW